MFLRLCWRAPRTVILVIAIVPLAWYFRNLDGSPGWVESGV